MKKAVLRKAGSVFERAQNQSRVCFALAGLALSLCGGIGLELCGLGIGHRGLILSSTPLTFETKVNTQSISAAGPLQAKISAWASALLGRPLFSPSSSSDHAMAQAAAKSPILPRLSAIMVSSNKKIGIFYGADGGPIIVTEGVGLGVFKVLSITADSVRVSGPAGIKALHIDYEGDQTAPDISVSSVEGDEEMADFPGSDSWPSQ